MDQAHQLRKIVSMLKENRDLKEKSKNRIVTITSGKGGVGKTTFTVNLAVSLSNRGFKVLIIDADFGFSNVNIALGIAVKYDLSHVLRKEKTISEIIAEGPNGIKFVSGGNGLTELINLSNESVEEYIKELMKLQNFADIILIDTGAGINEHILKFILSSDEVILITTPEPTALIDAYSLTKTVANLNRNIQFKLVVNMAQSVSEALSTSKNFIELTNKYLNIKVDSLGYLLSDKSVADAVRHQTPFLIYHPKCDVSKCLQETVNRFLKQTENKKSKNSIQDFFKKFITNKF